MSGCGTKLVGLENAGKCFSATACNTFAAYCISAVPYLLYGAVLCSGGMKTRMMIAIRDAPDIRLAGYPAG
jgi:hypothetical protein